MQFYDFGNGKDGAIPINGFTNSCAVASAVAGSKTVTSSLSVSSGDYVWLHQSREGGSLSGYHEIVVVDTPGVGSFTVRTPITHNYNTIAQAIKIPQFGPGVISSQMNVPAWNGATGGVAVAVINGVLYIDAGIEASFAGFRGQAVEQYNASGQGEIVARIGLRSESNLAYNEDRVQSPANGNSGTGGGYDTNDVWSGGTGGGGASNGTQGTNGVGSGGGNYYVPPGLPGAISGSDDCSQMTFGGSGGEGGLNNTLNNIKSKSSAGGNGGGLIYLMARSIIVRNGWIHANGDQGIDNGGSNGNSNGYYWQASGGGGAGGSIFLKGLYVDLGTGKVQATGGRGGYANWNGSQSVPGDRDGGDGGQGRIRVEACKIAGTPSSGKYTSLEGGLGFCGSAVQIV